MAIVVKTYKQEVLKSKTKKEKKKRSQKKKKNPTKEQTKKHPPTTMAFTKHVSAASVILMDSFLAFVVIVSTCTLLKFTPCQHCHRYVREKVRRKGM